MNKNNHVIVINGRPYNAKTGENLSHPPVSAAAHHTPAHKPAVHPHTAVHAPARQPASHVAAHRPKAARTLMRQVVQKPPANVKRHLKIQGRLDSQLRQPSPKPPARSPRIRHHAGKAARPSLISHFSPNLFTTVTHVPADGSAPPASPQAPHQRAASSHPAMRPAFAPRKPQTAAELLEYAVRYAASPPEPEEPVRRKHSRKLLKRHAHAGAR